MGVGQHLGIRVDEYDARIRTFIPFYEEILDAAATAIAVGTRGAPLIVDLGIGSGALAARCLQTLPRARVIGIDGDPAMLALAHRRLPGKAATITANFETTPLPTCHAITASFALHHVRTAAAKARLYRRCYRALRSGGVLVNADCSLAATAHHRRADRRLWHAHLAAHYGARRAERFLRAWAKEDVYFSLDDELAMMRRARFRVDVVWRKASFAVIAGTKVARSGG